MGGWTAPNLKSSSLVLVSLLEEFHCDKRSYQQHHHIHSISHGNHCIRFNKFLDRWWSFRHRLERAHRVNDRCWCSRCTCQQTTLFASAVSSLHTKKQWLKNRPIIPKIQSRVFFWQINWCFVLCSFRQTEKIQTASDLCLLNETAGAFETSFE